MMLDKGFWQGRRVLVTGHTGFKGSWMCVLLRILGADVSGFALDPSAEPSMFDLLDLSDSIHDMRGDIRDLRTVRAVFHEFQPEVVIHMAAQPIVREGYKDPVGTYATNVMGTVHVLECVRDAQSVRSVVNVTTDKVYRNLEQIWAYRENDILDGYDPYSNSKSCSELVTACYRRSFFDDDGTIALSAMRAGNVIGGGDFSKDRIIPDLVRSTLQGEPTILRNPDSVRPYQHVLEPVSAYLYVAQRQWDEPEFAGAYNIGPIDGDFATTAQIADGFCALWGDGATWEARPDRGPHEAGLLRLDASLVAATFDWRPRWMLDEALEKTVEWYRAWSQGSDLHAVTQEQIEAYLGGDR